jgi:uncharacterized protein (TIGR02646 family)
MIKIDRKIIPAPSSLNITKPKWDNLSEKEYAIKQFELHIGNGEDILKFAFEYAIYKHDEVKAALERLFNGKCAYCESRYAETQPMDVEHWRPKGKVVTENGGDLPGYYWLASDWDNLFPSCIDCNRKRKHIDVVDGRKKNIGKKNSFPVEGDHLVKEVDENNLPHEKLLTDEKPLLIDPCRDDPSQFLEWDCEEAIVRPKNGHRKGKESIEVYALNRVELVHSRQEVMMLMEQRMKTIRDLENLLDDYFQGNMSPRDQEIQQVLLDIYYYEVENLMEFANPERPYSAMAQSIIDQFKLGLEL